MNTVFLGPPRTIMEVFKSLPEGTLAEVIDNRLSMSPAPNPFHQEVAINLSTDLNLYIRKKPDGESVFSSG